MNFFFNPSAIAVVGATPDPFKGGYSILKNIINGFNGEVYPVNPRYDQIEGLPCYPSVNAIPGPVDLAIVFVPAKGVPEAINDCIRKGVSGVMIESAGFAEIGPEGKRMQEQVLAAAKGAGVRLWGPNCMGLVDAVNRRVFSFLDPRVMQLGLTPGNVSLVVQSGMLSAGYLVDIMSHGIMGISKVCSIGNKMDVDESDLLQWLLGDPDTKVIGLYLESIADGRRFVEICRSSPKPIVVLKGGKSEKGARAAMSHTASLAGNNSIIKNVLAQAGVVEADDFKQMTDICRSLAMTPPRKTDHDAGVAILTFSGGAGIVSSDFLDSSGLNIAELSESTKEQLKAIFPDWMPVSNPVDLWPAMEKHFGRDMYSESLRAVLGDPAVDAVLLHVFVGTKLILIDLEDIAEQSRKAGKPVFIWLLGEREQAFQFQKAAGKLGVPVFQELHRTVECLVAAMRPRVIFEKSSLSMNPDSLPVLSADLQQALHHFSGPLDEFISKRILTSYGLPCIAEEKVGNVVDCKTAAGRLGYPLVMKGLQPGAVHKTELGLVQLDIPNKTSAVRTFKSLMKKMGGNGSVLMQKQIKGHLELIMGMLRDPQFGPCVMIGLGGVMAEAFRDAAFAMAPLNCHDALDLIGRIQGQRLLDGFRGMPPVNRDELAKLLVALGDIGLAYPRIREIDVNPLIVTADGFSAVDATIVVS